MSSQTSQLPSWRKGSWDPDQVGRDGELETRGPFERLGGGGYRSRTGPGRLDYKAEDRQAEELTTDGSGRARTSVNTRIKGSPPGPRVTCLSIRRRSVRVNADVTVVEVVRAPVGSVILLLPYY